MTDPCVCLDSRGHTTAFVARVVALKPLPDGVSHDVSTPVPRVRLLSVARSPLLDEHGTGYARSKVSLSVCVNLSSRHEARPEVSERDVAELVPVLRNKQTDHFLPRRLRQDAVPLLNVSQKHLHKRSVWERIVQRSSSGTPVSDGVAGLVTE